MNYTNRFVHSAMHVCRLDSDTVSGRTLIEICDQKRVLIEHHLGIINYGSNEISVKVSYGKAIVSGEDLKLRLLSKEKMVICGRIDCVTLCREM